MSTLVHLTTQDDIAIITIDNPPVNALSPGVPEGILQALDSIEKDKNVRACVLIGAGSTFVAGADIKEFVKITSGQGRLDALLPLFPRLESCRKPIVGTSIGIAGSLPQSAQDPS